MVKLGAKKATCNQTATNGKATNNPETTNFPTETLFYNTTYGAPYGENMDKRSTLLNHMSGVMDLFVECDACTQNMIKTHYEIEDMYESNNYADAKYRHKYLLEDIMQMTKDTDGGEGDLEIVMVWLQEIINKMDEFGNTREIDVVM